MVFQKRSYIKRVKTGVISVVGKNFDILFITQNKHNIFLIYLYIYHLGHTHTFIFCALIHFNNYYSTVTRQTKPTEVI